jgi:hypothetical protein
MTAADHDQLGEALEAGESVVLGVLSSTDPDRPPTESEVTERVTRWLDMLGLDPATTGPRLGLSATCGLAGASHGWARQVLPVLRTIAANLD